MSIEENKALVRQFVEEFWNRGNTAAADELMTAEATIFLPGRGQVNKESFKAFALSLRSAFPDWYSTPEELIAEFRGLFDGLSMLQQLGAIPDHP